MLTPEIVLQTLASFDTPPSLTDLRERLEQKYDASTSSEELRGFLLNMVARGQISLTQNRKLYR